MENGTKLILFELLLLSLLIVAMGGPLKALRQGRIPKGMPEGMTIEEFLESRGQGRKKHAKIRKLARRIKQRLLKPGGELPDDADDRFDDLVFTEEQIQAIDQMLSISTGSGEHTRRKRKVINFDVFTKWDTPTILYQLDGTHTQEQQAHIRMAMDHWAEKTCIRFVEGSQDIGSFSYIYITRNDSSGCWSYVGRAADVGPQILNLAASCFYSDGRYGTVIHELGHALGLVHEHTRHDRDDYITIVEENIRAGKESQFAKWLPGYLDDRISAKVHYDYGSIMHYGATAFSTNGNATIVSKKPMYASAMGQRHFLTFWDAYAINLVYCTAECGVTTEPPCLRGGYQDPNNCGSCVCPEGFAGQYCEQDVTNTTGCSDAGRVALGSEQQCIQVQTPSWSSDLICDWHVQAHPGYNIRFWFESLSLAYFPATKACFDFVEVKYVDNLADRGLRFCVSVPSVHFSSNINELMVSFRGYLNRANYYFIFKLCFEEVQGATPDTTFELTSATTASKSPIPVELTSATTAPKSPTTVELTSATTASTSNTTIGSASTATNEATTAEVTKESKKHNRSHKDRTKKLNKKLAEIFGSTTPSNLPQKRKALRKLLRELLGSGDVHGEGDSY